MLEKESAEQDQLSAEVPRGDKKVALEAANSRKGRLRPHMKEM